MTDAGRTLLVTGGAGFAGGYVVREALERGYKVVVLDVADYRPETRFVIGELISEVAFERGSMDNLPRVLEVVQRHKPWAIAHLGNIMDLGLLDRNPMLALKVNVEGSLNVFEAARLLGVERVTMTSTIGVIGRKKYEPIDGDHPTVLANTGPIGAYSAAKLAVEAFAYTYKASFGLEFRIVRPSALYGFGMSWFAPNYMKQIVEPAAMGQAVKLTRGGSMPRDYCHAADLASLVVATLTAPKDADRVFYAATGRPLRTGGDVGTIVANLIPGSEIEVGGELTEADNEELAFRGMISIENARTQLGWEPKFGALEEGIADYLARVRDYLAAGGTLAPQPQQVVGSGG
jgi:nucleoside-diphosphate-sugar epimerase